MILYKYKRTLTCIVFISFMALISLVRSTDIQKVHRVSKHINLHFTNPGFGKYTEATFMRHGDVLTDCVVKINLPKLEHGLSWVPHVGKLLIKKMLIKIQNIT